MEKPIKRQRIAKKQLAVLLFILGNQEKLNAVKSEDQKLKEQSKRDSNKKKADIKYNELVQKSIVPPFITPNKLIKEYVGKGESWRKATVNDILTLLEKLDVLKKNKEGCYIDEECAYSILKHLSYNKSNKEFTQTQYYQDYKKKIKNQIIKELDFYWAKHESDKKEWIKWCGEEVDNEISKTGNFLDIIGFEDFVANDELISDLFEGGQKLEKIAEKLWRFRVMLINTVSIETANKFLKKCFEISNLLNKDYSEEEWTEYERQMALLMAHIVEDSNTLTNLPTDSKELKRKK